MLPEHAHHPATRTRRAFLRTLGLAGGGLVTASLVAACQGAGAPSNTAPSGPPPPKPTAGQTAPAGQAAPAAGAAAFPIGATISLTGRYAQLGEQVNNGYTLAFDDLNKAGPTHKASGQKFTLNLKVLDNASDPSTTVQQLESLNSSDQVLAYLGGAGSDLHAASANVADKNRVPYLGVAFALFSVHQRGLKYLFSPFPKSPQMAKNTFDQMDSLSPKPTKLAIFAEQSDWGQELRDLWHQEASSRGYELVADEQYAPGSKDFSPQILKAKSGGAQAVLALPTPPDGIAMAKQMKELDFNADYYWFVRAADGLDWGTALGPDGNFFVNCPGWSPDLKFPGVDQLKVEHQARFNKPAEALTGAAYSAIQILFDAVSRSAKLGDRDALRDALAATDLSTVAGPIKFNSDGSAQMITVFNQWQSGKQVLVWPKDQAASELQYPAKPWSQRG